MVAIPLCHCSALAQSPTVIACIGAGLRAYTQFDRVELPNGDSLDASTFLDEVQKEVLDAILTDVLLCDINSVSVGGCCSQVFNRNAAVTW